MIKIGITGSIASGKTTASKIISKNRGPLFSADQIVAKLYQKKSFKEIVIKKLNLRPKFNFKSQLRNKIIDKRKNLKILEKIIHPLVRKEMIIFLKKNKSQNFLFFEIPLLIENKLTKYFNTIIFIRSKRELRLKRYKLNGGNTKLFSLLDKKQTKDTQKMKLCDHVVVNNKSLFVLKKNLLNIIHEYE